MKKLLFILFLPLLASAEHHRGHALMHLDSAQSKLDKVTNHLNAMPICANWTADQLVSLGQIHTYLDFADERLEIARAALNDVGNLDALETARRAMQQPVPAPSVESSAVRTALYVETLTARLIPNSCPESTSSLQQIVTQASFVWGFFDFAAWHINDAIREEIYQDPIFICSGPGNHCE